jgi:hypothetical protein
MKKDLIIILFFIAIVNSKLFQKKDIVDDAKCTIGDLEDANSLLNPLLNQLRVNQHFELTTETNIF